ncbi:hypothetical protein ES708_32513 [subsurface metagenome]
MNKNLEELKKIEDKIFETNIKKSDYKTLTHKITFRYVLVEALEDFEKRLKTVEAELGIHTEEEKKNIKNGIGSYCLYA